MNKYICIRNRVQAKEVKKFKTLCHRIREHSNIGMGEVPHLHFRCDKRGDCLFITRNSQSIDGFG